jgi:Apea-like HEPN
MFHFPALFLVPDFTEETITHGRFRLARRLWQTSTFDLATLVTKHTLHLPYQVMDVFLGRCNLEIGIEAANLKEATRRLQAIRLALYSEGISPFIVPFVTTYSVNEYSGINSRDSGSLRDELPEGLREGLTSETGHVEAWPVELCFQCVVLGKRLEVTPQAFARAGEKAEEWMKFASAQQSVRAFGQAVLSARLVFPLSQSVLHIWCAVESLFPSVTAELSFRLALYMAQLAADGPDRRTYFERVKKGYNVRSKIAHGAKQDVTDEEWNEAWGFLTDALKSIFSIGKVPKEQSLLDGLLGPDGST